MVVPNDFFTTEEKMHLAQITSTFTVVVKDQETFNDFLFTIRKALDHDEATKLLAMSAAVIAGVSNNAMERAAGMLMNIKAKDN